ncbi:LOW QUALITY PROTEIN: hypothetical protein N665_0098s0027 [Sinapis alba]|nr:LOW QUALITY PROTEIN: hypothetical protein N665_0098s0027 [Sinapis alba]
MGRPLILSASVSGSTHPHDRHSLGVSHVNTPDTGNLSSVSQDRRIAREYAQNARQLRKAICKEKNRLGYLNLCRLLKFRLLCIANAASIKQHLLPPAQKDHNAEALRGQKRQERKQFSLCCQKGRVRLPPVRQPPSPLLELLDSPNFKPHIRVANSLLAFTSMGAQVDQSVTGTLGPFSYWVHGQIIHRIGSMLPDDGNAPEYLQLYIFDTDNELDNRKRAFSTGNRGYIILQLIEMMDNNNHRAKTFRHAHDRFNTSGSIEFSITLASQPARGRQYDLPTANEIGGLIVGDISATSVGRDSVVELRSSALQRISVLHPLLMSLQYLLLFPYGETGYSERLPYEGPQASTLRREYMTIPTEGMTIIKGGRLMHQYIVDAYVATETERLRFINLNQKKLRTELYNNVCDAVERDDADATHIGKKFILPSSFTAGPRYMAEKHQDAMAICRWYGNPHMFITVTANPKWLELTNHLDAYGGDYANNRLDLECRIFKQKLDEMMVDFKKGVYFPKPDAEFQKRGLPHAHILLWLKGLNKEVTAATIDEYISAEFLDKEVDREGFDLVERHMVHGPCGKMRPKSPCMDRGECTQSFPKPLSERTRIDKSRFVVYKRRHEPTSVIVKGDMKLDNRYVVSYNLSLVKKYQAHINVEWCCRTSAIKYLFKYIIKGVDRATVLIEKYTPERTNMLNEIDRFLECRYISACEGAWRLFAFPIHYNQPNVVKIPIHIPGQHMMGFAQSNDLSEVFMRENIEKTMLTAFFEECDKYEEARELTYVEFPSRFVYHPVGKMWTPRHQVEAIYRVVYISPAAGDLYFLRILVNVVRGPRSFDELYTVGDVVFKKLKEACYARGLLDDDKEWHEAIEEPSIWATGLDLEDEQLKQYTLLEVEKHLKEHNQSLADYKDMPQPDKSILSEINKPDLRAALQIKAEAETHILLFGSLNQDQRNVYDAVMKYVEDQSGQLFFVSGAGGTGKTYLYRAIIAALRSVSKVVIPVATAGIAALLLPGGRTDHSRFKLPLTLDDCSMCNIHYGSSLAALISKAYLIIWDKSPMAHRHAFETLDHSLKDLLSHDNPLAATLPFGGKTVLLGGDFRQILPVIPNGNRTGTVLASISKSYLWKLARIFSLSINMRLRSYKSEMGKLTLCLLINQSMSKALANAAYPDFLHNYRNKEYLKERDVLTPTNSTVHEAREYLSSDSIELMSTPDDDWTSHYPQEYLNSLEFPGIPNHRLCLKVGYPVMMMHNFNQDQGLCNGTRMMVTRLGNIIVEAEIMTGTYVREHVLIPRIQLSPTDTIHPFTFRRRQFPIRLCYAMAIIKSQGQSLNQVALYLPRPVFTHGRLYVAMSRVTTPTGLKILDETSDNNGEDGVTNIVYKEIFKDVQVIQVRSRY